MSDRHGLDRYADFGGLHCETASLRKLLAAHGHAVSEEMLLGLGGGIGFMHLPGPPGGRGFTGGRNGPFPDFTRKMAAGVGLRARLSATDDPAEGYRRLLAELDRGTPVICYGDLYHLPYFCATRHFGGHAFVVYAVDEAADEVWISDRCRAPRVVRTGELAAARGSAHQPFPPRHTLLLADFAAATGPRPAAVRAAVRASAEAMLQGGALTGLAALDAFGAHLTGPLRGGPAAPAVDRLAAAFVDLELAGTGGAAFRRMYLSFLREAAELTGDPAIGDGIGRAEAAVRAWTELIGLLLPDHVPGLAALRRALTEREEALLDGGEPALRRAAELTAALPGLRRAAEPDTARHGRDLAAGLGAALRRVIAAERALAETLRRCEVPR